MALRYHIAWEARCGPIIPGILRSSPIFPRVGLSLPYLTARTLATTTLPPPSNAQTRAIKILQMSRANILFNACAGSGKTTTILHLAAASPDKYFLVMVYNNRLMIETNGRIAALGLENAVVYNYHTLGHRFYSPECDTDQGLKRIIRDRLPVMQGKKLPLCDVLVLDEQQDMTPILKTFIDRVVQHIEDIKNSKSAMSSMKGAREQEGGTEPIDPLQSSTSAGGRLSPVRLVLLGDPRQELYEFNGADARFLTLASLRELFGNEEAWEFIQQNRSYRLTKPNADLINNQMLRPAPGEEVVSVKDKAPDGSAFPRPRYVFYKPLGEDPIVDYEPFKEVQRLLGKMDHSDILVPAPSLRSRDVIDLANCLALKGHPVLVSADLEHGQSVSLSESAGKITICTYHQSKGIEREAALMYGFDESYHLHFNKTPGDTLVAGNPQYVAATRAKTDLVTLHHCQYEYLPFIDPETLGDTCEIVNMEIHSPNTRDGGCDGGNIAVTTLTRNIHDRDMSACIQELELEQISRAYQGSSPPSEIGIGGGLVESVADITGAAAPAMYEYYTKGRRDTHRRLSSFASLFQCFGAYNKGMQLAGKRLFKRIQDDRPEINDHLRIVLRRMAANRLDDGDILFLANFSSAIKSGLLVKLLSIPLDRYPWVEPKHRWGIISILSKHVPPGCRFEQSISYPFGGTQLNSKIGIGRTCLHGLLDISDLENKRVWEVKYTQKLRVEHILQTALYAGLVEANHGKGSDCKLINAMSGEVIGIKPKTENSYESIIQRLMNAKITKPATLSDLTDEEFIKEAGNEFENYIGPVVLPPWFNYQKIRRSRKSAIVGGAEPAVPSAL